MPQFETHRVNPFNVAADTAEKILLSRIASRQAAEALARKIAQEDFENEIKAGELGVKVKDSNLNRDKFGFEQSKWTDEAPQRAATVAKTTADTGATNAGTAKTLQETRFAGDDRSRAIAAIEGLSKIPTGPGRVSPQAAASLKKFAGVDFLTPAGERALLTPSQIGAETGGAEGAAWDAGGKKVYAGKSAIDTAADIQKEGAKAGGKADQSKEQADAMVDEALETIKTLRGLPGKSSAVGAPDLSTVGGAVNAVVEPFTGRPVAGTDAADFTKYLDALRAKITLPRLQTMRGLGALSDAEGRRIEAAASALDRAMKEGTFDKELDNIEQSLLASKRRRTGTTSDKTVTTAELEKLAQKRGTTVEQERTRATAAGYVVR